MKSKQSGQRGVTLLEVAIGSLLTVTVILALTSVLHQNLEFAGSNRNSGAFSSPPYTTLSSLPIPEADISQIRIRSDSDDSGPVATAPPEDVTVSWNSAAKTLTVGPTTYEQISNFGLTAMARS